jgi:hypothetical protein
MTYLVAGRYVVGKCTSAEHCDVSYRRVVDSSEINLKTSWEDIEGKRIENWLQETQRSHTNACGPS